MAGGCVCILASVAAAACWRVVVSNLCLCGGEAAAGAYSDGGT